MVTFKLTKINSREEPSEQERKEMVKLFEEKFGWGDDIEKTFIDKKWGNRPAMKQVAKIMMNSVWGKHAQRAEMPQSKIYTTNTQVYELANFFQNVYAKKFEFNDLVYLANQKALIKYTITGETVYPDLHGGYIPAACFVPAYGRLQLEEQLFKLGKRALMNDTDSIIYHFIPNQYNIPEGNLLGDWEVEDFDSKNGGIVEFVGLGPKTYALKTANGKTLVKAKGISLNYATGTIVNFDTMKSLALAHMPDDVEPQHKRIKTEINVPQVNFIGRIGSGIQTWRSLKKLKIDPKEMKGDLINGKHSITLGILYPTNYHNPNDPDWLSPSE